ncbi:MAG: iron-siderophore ABC transporter substrate-binding protein [Ilumatobacter sp.]|uniref:iron-siderophore ABC transporter substrate-binding protein n=1 Tax=Ilumatobacter sp. TaxID=1967498 RepID=UPI00391B23BB
MTRRLIGVVAVLALLGAACGSDDNARGSDEAPENDTAADVDAPAVSVESNGSTGTNDGTNDETAAFPVTIEHKFGETTIDTEPMRVVSVGFNEHDFLLALGVVPVGLRDWYGDQPNSVWPWAQDELGDATPEVIASSELNFEQIAALDPDLIVGVWSGMTDADYELLSAIAPTVAQPETYEDYGTPWQEQTMILGRATGREAQAAEVVADIEAEFAAIRDAHPEWEGMTASVAFVTEDGPGAYTSQDTRSRIMTDLGFTIPDANDSGGEGSFFLELSPEDISPLDVDVLVWVAGAFEQIEGILTSLPTRPSLTAVQEGREIFADLELTGAFSHGSPLSLEYALERLVPEIEAAADGDLSTPVPSAVEAGATLDVAGAPEQSDTDPADTDPADTDPADTDPADTDGADAAGDAASAAWALVFDSTVSFADKAMHLADAAALESTVAAYAAAGEGFGGITLAPTGVAASAEVAEITYDVNFGGNPAYGDQIGTIELVDGVWTVSRDEFCSFMSSARVSCP